MSSAADLDRDLPWSEHPDPWAVLVSEVMLQQTPVSRVRAKWTQFLLEFPTPRALAEAPLARALAVWSGLGYPRRLKNLRDASRAMLERHDGKVPDTLGELLALPGVGPYTARAVLAFAFGESVGVVDTNVGRVLARAVANRRLRASEAQSVVDRLVTGTDPRAFNQAMLDVGAAHCRATPICGACPLVRVCRWHIEGGEDPSTASAGVSRPQGAFAGSDRAARGRLMRRLLDGEIPRSEAVATLDANDPARADRLLCALEGDGLISLTHATVVLAS